jgi:hypothetical protein
MKKISIIATDNLANEVLDAVIQYNYSAKANHFNYHLGSVDKSLLIFIIYSSHQKVDETVLALPFSNKDTAIVGVELQTTTINTSQNTELFDIIWKVDYNKNSALLISSGIKMLLDLGNVDNAKPIMCIDLADIIFTLKETKINNMQFSFQHNNSVTLMIKEVLAIENAPQIVNICIYYYLISDFDSVMQELKHNIDNLTQVFDKNTDIIFNGSTASQNVNNPLITNNKQHIGIIIMY